MNDYRVPMRWAAIVTAAVSVVSAILAVSTAAQAAHPIRIQPFAADSGDACRYGTTSGSLAFRAVHPPERPAVDLWGTLTDRPLPNDPSVCGDDRRFTVATYTAYAGSVVIDREANRVDNGRLAFTITLIGTDSTSTAPIDRVVIQVCRHSTNTWIPPYCGTPQTYKP